MKPLKIEGSSPSAPAQIERRGPTQLSVGFMPLVDCAPLIVAAEKGFAGSEDLRLNLIRETSWANIRDRVMLGHFDAAHMLGPLPIASTLGVGGHLRTPMIAPFALGFGGNAITLSTDLWQRLQALGVRIGDSPEAVAAALAATVAQRRERLDAPLTLAMVYPFSGHNYELRYWLASAGIDPDRDIRLVVLPPPFMADALKEGHVDGFCVGEPWSSLAVERGHGVIAVTKSMLWRHGPEKVLGMRATAVERPVWPLNALLQALYKAAAWADDPGNHDELAEILSADRYVGAPAATIRQALSGTMPFSHGGAPARVPDFLGFHSHAANFPWQSHALWYYSQMVRWGQTSFSREKAEIARQVYRPDLYRKAMAAIGADLPSASAKVEGALTAPTPVASNLGHMILGPDGFFDGVRFDPADVEGYLRRLGVTL
jgi:two-component system, oxyanion-binding sensor